MKKFFSLGFLPTNADCALFLLRVWFGLTLLLNHGWQKLMNFQTMKGHLPDPLGIGATPNMALLIFAEVVCSVLLVLGLAARFAALVIAIEMGVAFVLVHHLKLAMGQGSGELAFLYLGPALAILFAGPGKWAADGS